MDTMLSTRQVSRHLNVNIQRVLFWIRQGTLPAVNISTNPDGEESQHRPRYRIDPSDLASFMASRRVVPQPNPCRKRPKKRQMDYWGNDLGEMA